MAAKPKILCCGELSNGAARVVDVLSEFYETVPAKDNQEAVALWRAGGVVACVSGRPQEVPMGGSDSNWSTKILDDLPDGVVLIDSDNVIRWANRKFCSLSASPQVEGGNFFSVLDTPEIVGPDFCPFHTTLATGQPSATRLRIADKLYYQLHVSPLREQGADRRLVVLVRDITREVHQQQKVEAIHRAGTMLTDLLPEELYDMTVEDRIELLKSNILHSTQDVLNFTVVEVRLLEQSTGRLVPLLAEGMDEEAAKRPLFAKPQGYGVTGFVAATGQSYLCEDTREDSLYLTGFAGARSSLTVPLVLHDDVIGTFNVENAKPHAFSADDLLFLENFARDVAIALNTLELLTAQSMNTALKSIEAIHRAVARPIDAILNDTVHVLETYIGHDPEIKKRLKQILREARDIRHLIQEVGKGMAPADAVPAVAQADEKERFQGVRVLVVDSDAEILDSAHLTLERYGCIVETAQTGGQAVFMVRASKPDAPYDVIITDVRLPDMTGHNLLVHLKVLYPDKVPLILMQGFGYDPGHSIVKARQEGLHPKAVLYKPFRVEQLLDGIETILEWGGE